ncbi:hypothetical protein GH733_001389 [Mirounga leonina]|nr:hypothetical protein GH733_001389 [Mirounga leonina]
MLTEERGGRDCSRDRAAAPPCPRALLGTADSASPPSSRGLQQLAPGPSLVRWARERRRAGGRSSPVPAPGGRAPRPPLARARVPSRRRRRRRGREQGTPPTERARTGESAAGAGRGGRGPLRMEGDKPANLGPQARRFPLGGGPLDRPNCDPLRTSHRHGHGKGFRNHRAWVCAQQQRGILGHAAGPGDWLVGRCVHVEGSPGASERGEFTLIDEYEKKWACRASLPAKKPVLPSMSYVSLKQAPCKEGCRSPTPSVAKDIPACKRPLFWSALDKASSRVEEEDQRSAPEQLYRRYQQCGEEDECGQKGSTIRARGPEVSTGGTVCERLRKLQLPVSPLNWTAANLSPSWARLELSTALQTTPQISVDPEREMSSGTLDHLESQASSRSISGVSAGRVRNWRESATHRQ